MNSSDFKVGDYYTVIDVSYFASEINPLLLGKTSKCLRIDEGFRRDLIVLYILHNERHFDVKELRPATLEEIAKYELENL